MCPDRSQRKRDGISSRCGCVFLNFDVNMICHEKMLCSRDSHGLNNRAHTYCMPIQNFLCVSVIVYVSGHLAACRMRFLVKKKWYTWLNITLTTGVTCIACQWLTQLLLQLQQHYVIFFILMSSMATCCLCWFLFEYISQAIKRHDVIS